MNAPRDILNMLICTAQSLKYERRWDGGIERRLRFKL